MLRRNNFKDSKKTKLINQIWEKKFDNNFKKKDEIDVMVNHMINLNG